MATRRCLVLYIIIIITMADVNGALRKKRIEKRLVRLEDRVDMESKFRREDMWDLFDRIESMSSVLNMSAKNAHCQGQLEGASADNTLQTSENGLHALATDLKTMLNKTEINQIKLMEHNHEITELKDQVLHITEQKNASSLQTLETGVHALATDLKTILNITEVNQIKLMEHIHEITELKDQMLRITEQKNASFEIAELKTQLNELNETCNLKTESSTLKNERFKSCVDVYQKGHRVSGQYDVYPDGRSDPIRVFCDQGIESGGGWTVFQRRKDGSEDFFRGWLDYKLGFGDLDGEFWLGNEYLAILTSNCCSQLRIDMENIDGEKKYALYNTFQIKSANERYKLKVDGYSGNADDSLSYHNGYQFTTKDLDNDPHAVVNCAIYSTGAWWYNQCVYSNLNGQFGKTSSLGAYWSGFSGKALRFTEMKFRRLL